MSKLNISLHLNAYRDTNPSNNPALNNFRWDRQLFGITVEKPESIEFCLAPGESKTLFNGARSLSHDNTTEYSLSLKTGTSNTYQLVHSGGTAPAFRTFRVSGADATTEVDISKNNTILTIESSAGTSLDLIVGGVQVGDRVKLGSVFNILNQGEYKVIARTATSLSIEAPNGVEETSIALGASFNDSLRIFSASGVQVGDKIKIFGGFSLVSRQTYEVTGVLDNTIEFFSTYALPEELDILTDDITVYSAAKQLIYVELDKKCDIEINGNNAVTVEPFVENNSVKPGVLLQKSLVWSMTITNNTTDTATLYFASAE